MYKLEFPYPDMRLLPNRKAHWAELMRATAEARYDAYVYCLAYKLDKPVMDKVEIEITWYPRSRKVADIDSLLRCCKPYLDSLVDAGIILDDSPKVIKQMTLRMGEVDKLNSRTEINIEEVKDELVID